MIGRSPTLSDLLRAAGVIVVRAADPEYRPETWEPDAEMWFGFYTPSPGETAACFHNPLAGDRGEDCRKPNAGGRVEHFLYRRPRPSSGRKKGKVKK